MRARAALLAAVMVLTPVIAAAQVSERIRIPFDDGELQAVLFRPEGSGPFPAVIAMHGCGGLWRANGELSLRHVDWGRRLAAAGLIVVMPDSYGSRRLGSQCGVKEMTVRASRERVADATVTRLYLLARRDVRPDEISLIGWSGGGSTVLAAIRTDRRPGDLRPDYKRAVAFYPNCRTQLDSQSFSARIPTLILMGEKDDWTPPATCQLITTAARARGEPVELVLYPDAVHDFDHPRLERKERDNVPLSATGTGIATVGTDPDARADAIRRVETFLLGRKAR